MNGKVMVALALFAVAGAVIFLGSTDSQVDAASGENIRVYIQDEYGEYQMAIVSASSVEGAIDQATQMLNMPVQLDEMGRIESVGGLQAPYGNWNIHQWMPLGNHGWASVGFDSKSDSQLITGTTYCLHYSETSIVEGTTVYGVPFFEPTADGYVFIRFVYEYDSDSDLITCAFTPDIRKDGFWIKGHGSNMGEVVEDAMNSNDFECQFTTSVDGNGNDLQWWITSFFGVAGSKSLGGDDNWAYWSQWMFVDYKWGYNDYTLGYYDPAVYPYVACVYIYSLNGSTDTGGSLPDPITDEIVLMERYLDVSFKVGGNVVGTTTVEYGTALTPGQIPEYEAPAGYEFLGWGDITMLITEDTVFEGTLTASSANKVTYMSDGKSVKVEYVEDGCSPTYVDKPYKDPTDTSMFEFVGWTLDPDVDNPVIVELSSLSITKDVTLTAVFLEKPLPTSKVTFVVDGKTVSTVDVVTGRSLDVTQIPEVSVKGHTFQRWNGDVTAVITEDTTFTAVLKVNEYRVKFVSDGATVYTEYVQYGKSPTYAGVPSKSDDATHSFAFIGWTLDDSVAEPTIAVLAEMKVESDTTFTAVFKSNPLPVYTVEFVLDGTTISAVEVVKGGRLSQSQIPTVTVQDGEVFSGWGDTSITITSDTVFVGTITVIQYNKVTYLSDEGALIYVEQVSDGGSPTYLGVPTKTDNQTHSFTFAGWTLDASVDEPALVELSTMVITSDTVLTAVFKSEPLPTSKVTFAADGKTISTVDVVTGKSLDAGQVPSVSVEGYTFQGWDKDVTVVITGDVEFVAILKINQYSVSFYSDSGTLLNKEVVDHGSCPTFSTTPVKPDSATHSFTFAGWTLDASVDEPALVELSTMAITSDTVLTAVFESEPLPTSKVTFMAGGKVISAVDVITGTKIRQSDVPLVAIEGYEFQGWDGDITVVITGDKTFTAILKVNTYKVSYYSEGGQLLHVEYVDHGNAATYDKVPSKEAGQQYTYEFDCWVMTSDSSAADLSAVKCDMDVKARFKTTVNQYKVTFYDYDGTVLHTTMVDFGSSVTDYPQDPTREQTVDKVFLFRGWSDSTAGYLPTNLSNIDTSKVTYANYSYVLRQYELRIHDGDTIVDTMLIDYGSFLSESVLMETVEGYLVKLYRDAACTQEIGPVFSITGDSDLYMVKVPGQYSYADTGYGEDASRIEVSFNEDTVKDLDTSGDEIVVADLSQFPDGKTLILDGRTLQMLSDELGSDTEVTFVLFRGKVHIGVGELLEVSGYVPTIGALSSNYVEVDIGKGPTSNVRINKSLKAINYDKTLTITVKVNGMVVKDIADLGMSLSVPYDRDSDPANEPRVWIADSNTGVLTEVGCTYSEGYLSFHVPSLPYYVVGTSLPRSDSVDNSDPCPYGDVEYEVGGEDAATYNSTLVRMTIDNNGDVLFLPSALEGYPLKHIGAYAFTGVIGTSTIVVPATVLTFDWSSLEGKAIYDVYFLGDAPEFIGVVPSTIQVHYAEGMHGWDGKGHSIMNIWEYTTDVSAFSYYLMEGEVVIHSHVKGTEFNIPEVISIAGSEYPVTIIGANAFMDSLIQYVKIPYTIKEIHTRAFYGSDLKEVTWSKDMMLDAIGDEAFRSCTALRTTSIPDGVRFIGFEAFRDCHMFISVTLPDSVIDIRDGAFYNCSRLADVEFGEGIVSLPSRAFAYCTVLDNITFPDNIARIESDAFYKCHMLSVISTNKVTHIGSGAFSDCYSLTDIVLDSALVEVADGTFCNNPALVSVEAYCNQPSGVERAFSNDGSENIPSSITIFVNHDVADGWTLDHQVMEKEDDLKRSFESRTMPYVISGMIVMFIIIGLVCLRYRL